MHDGLERTYAITVFECFDRYVRNHFEQRANVLHATKNRVASLKDLVQNPQVLAGVAARRLRGEEVAISETLDVHLSAKLDAPGGSNAPELRLKVPCIRCNGFAKILVRGKQCLAILEFQKFSSFSVLRF